MLELKIDLNIIFSQNLRQHTHIIVRKNLPIDKTNFNNC